MQKSRAVNLSFGDKNLSTVIAYALNQKEHHHRQTTHEVMEKWSEEDDGVVACLDEPAASPPHAKAWG